MEIDPTKKIFPSHISTNKEAQPEKAKQKIEQIAQDQLNKIQHIQIQEEATTWEKIKHHPNPFVLTGHLINEQSILRGALKNWDSTRLLTGKHASFDQIGGEHLQIHTKYNDTIDATYLEASAFAKQLEKFGGQKVVFKPFISDQDPYKTKENKISLKNGFSFNGLQIDPSSLTQHQYDIRPIEQYYKLKNMVIIQDAQNELYAVPDSIFHKLKANHQLQENILKEDIVDKKSIDSDRSELSHHRDTLSTEFPGYYFDKQSPELKNILENLDIAKTPWILKEYGDKAFLIRRRDLPSLELCYRQDPSLHNLELKKTKTIEHTAGQGTVILSMNQTEIYEQFGSEFLTFALDGVNVIAYNNGGKGLSQGLNDSNSINNAIEVVYQYLKKIKNVPDIKILAKGQCFGGAPSAWLGSQHPEINIMIDQSPANFYDPASKIIKDKVDLDRVVFRFLGINYLIDGVAKGLFAGYNSAENLRQNKGNHLIHHNIPSKFGAGGDKLVSDVHIRQFLEYGEEGKLTSISYNPGATHVTNWFSNETCYLSIMNFIENIGLTSNMYELEESSPFLREEDSEKERDIPGTGI